MRTAARAVLDAFNKALMAVPAVVSAQRLFGDPDYQLRVLAANLGGYQKLYDELLATLPGVQRLTSTLVMKNIIDNRPPPL